MEWGICLPISLGLTGFSRKTSEEGSFRKEVFSPLKETEDKKEYPHVEGIMLKIDF